MVAGGGGWMAFQRRFDGSVDFHTKLWNDYKNGFGNVEGEYWLGNGILHEITSAGTYDLFVVVKSFKGVTRRKQFKGFTIGSEETKYVFRYNSVDPGFSNFDLFLINRNMKFTTADQDNDNYPTNCAALYHGGWWFDQCHHDHMNGLYSQTEACPRGEGLHWKALVGHYECLKETMLLIKKQP